MLHSARLGGGRMAHWRVVGRCLTTGVKQLLYALMEKPGDEGDTTSRERVLQIIASLAGP